MVATNRGLRATGPPSGSLARRPGARATFVCGAALAVLLAFLGGCAGQFGPAEGEVTECADRRITAAIISFEDAKGQFAEHFKVRSDTALVFAFQASVDSVRLARSVRKCFDFERGHRTSALHLIASNRALQGLIRKNFRDADAQTAIGLFGDQYREIFKNDIR